MFILGAGSAYPEGKFTDDLIASLGLSVSAAERSVAIRCGICSRRSTLPTAYLSESKGKDALDARKVTTITPTGLGLMAAKQALARAGITPDQLGLIVAECATPHQTCPSEAQRLGGALGLKIPAYDITAGASALPLSLSLFESWKLERVPDYVLCVSVNTPTELIRYSDDALPALVLGDAASAVVISAKHRGRLSVSRTFLDRDRSVQSPIAIKRWAAIDSQRLVSQDVLRDRLSAGLLNLGATQGAYFIGPQLFCGELAAIAGALGIPEEKVVCESVEHGYSLGASAGCCLTAVWDRLKVGDEVAILHEGDGMSSGVLMKAGA